VAARTFTPSEANSALAQVRPLAERMVRVRARIGELESEQRDIVKLISGNGHGEAIGEARSPEFNRLVTELEDCVTSLSDLGVEIKDVESGLLDFPAERDGEDVLLCWRVGEESVEWWHGPDDGFAGRRRVDWGDT
jgi:hypothetical protein